MKKKFRFEPKQDLFRSCFGLFRETKKKFRFVSVFRTYIETTETNRTVSKRTETIRNVLKNLSYIYLGSSVCHIPEGGIRDGETGDGEIEKGGCE